MCKIKCDINEQNSKIKLNQVQLFSLVNIIMVKIKIGLRIIQLSVVLNSYSCRGFSDWHFKSV